MQRSGLPRCPPRRVRPRGCTPLTTAQAEAAGQLHILDAAGIEAALTVPDTPPEAMLDSWALAASEDTAAEREAAAVERKTSASVLGGEEPDARADDSVTPERATADLDSAAARPEATAAKRPLFAGGE